jgi:hypothetical protein
MRVSAVLLFAAAAAIPRAADAQGKGGGRTKTTTTGFDQAFEAELCAAMLNDIYGKGAAASDSKNLCQSGHNTADTSASRVCGCLDPAVAPLRTDTD